MGFQFNGLKAAVTISGSVGIGFPSPTTNQTIVQKAYGKGYQAITAGTGATLYTVTAGKTLYISSLTVCGALGAANSIEIRDNGSGGTIIYGSRTYEGTSETYARQTFPTPLKFSTNVWIDVAANASITWAFSGWEE